MAYQALYRAWRPARFADMVGQEEIVQTLRRQVETDKISHAYLFCGSRGTGKTSAAKILARAINCTDSKDGDACGHCASCLSLLDGESLDVIEMDAASNNGVENIRDLREQVNYPPTVGKFKVYIIDEVHMLSGGAFNALLKTLEEPPFYVVFILATTEPQKIPATILSRCQRFDFARIPAAKITAHLQKITESMQLDADEKALMSIARAAEGGMRDALSILDMCLSYSRPVDEELVRMVLGSAGRPALFAFADAIAKEDPGQLMLQVDQLMRDGHEPLVFAKELSRHFRALLLAAHCPDQLGNLLDLVPEDEADYIRQSKQFTQSRMMRVMELFMDVETAMRTFSSPRLALENAAIKACLRTQETDRAGVSDELSRLQKQVDALSKKIEEGVPVQRQPKTEASAPTAEKKPKPAPKPAAPVAGTAAWQAALVALQKTAPTVIFPLKSAKLLDVKNNRFEIELDNPVFVQIVSKPDNKAALLSALNEATGQECELLLHEPQAAPSASTADPKILNDLKTTFGAENVRIHHVDPKT